jgi:hypothetical protein
MKASRSRKNTRKAARRKNTRRRRSSQRGRGSSLFTPSLLDWTCPSCEHKNKGTAGTCSECAKSCILARSLSAGHAPCREQVKPGEGLVRGKPMVGLGPDTQWTPDEDAPDCSGCGIPFKTSGPWKHHCRRCGKVICDNCSYERELYLDGFLTSGRFGGGEHIYDGAVSENPLRVCKPCVHALGLLEVPLFGGGEGPEL